MKKRRQRVVTIAALLAALFGSGGGIAWGQVTPSYSDCNNDYGAGESTIITPPGGGVNFGSVGRITLGGNTRNQVLYARNQNQAGSVTPATNNPCWKHQIGNVTYANSPFTYCNPQGGTIASADYVSGEGSGILTVPANAYNTETHIQIRPGLLEFEHFNFTPIPWYYRRTILKWWTCYSNSCSYWNGTSTVTSPAQTGTCSDYEPTGTPYQESFHGGYVNGHITVDAGAKISLTGKGHTPIGIRNIANTGAYSGYTGADTRSKLTLPTLANPYTLQVKQLFDANSFNASGNIDGIPDMAQQAVLGLWTGINNPAITDATVGGTFLIGNATQHQNQLTLNSGSNGGTLANYYHHTNTEQRPGGSWDNKSITTTDAVVHDVNISGTSGGTHITFNLNSTGDMTIENTQCAALNFNGKFAPTIGGDGALRINPRTWTTTGNLEYPTVFSPLNLPPVCYLPQQVRLSVGIHTLQKT